MAVVTRQSPSKSRASDDDVTLVFHNYDQHGVSRNNATVVIAYRNFCNRSLKLYVLEGTGIFFEIRTGRYKNIETVNYTYNATINTSDFNTRDKLKYALQVVFRFKRVAVSTINPMTK